MIGLHSVGQPLEIDDRLVELEGVGRVVVGGREVAAGDHAVGREIAAAVDPTIDLHVAVVHPLAELGVAERDHERAVDGIRPCHADVGRSAVGPFGERHRRRGLRSVGPAGAARGRRLGVGGRPVVPPFQPVVVDEPLEEPVAEIFIETVVVPVRRIRRAAVRRRDVRSPGGADQRRAGQSRDAQRDRHRND